MVHGKTGCQLYLILPPDKNRDAVLKFVNAGDFSQFASALVQSGSDGKVDRGFAETLLRLTREANIPLLLEDDISAAIELGADGVHIRADEELYTQARKELGGDAIIGVECGFSRHTGLSFAELGADYIAFSGQTATQGDETAESMEDLISWWAETVIVPCVAWDIDSIESAHQQAKAGADFVAMNEPIWSHPMGPSVAASDFSASLEKQRALA